jgi:hypothetical protein
MTIDTTYLKTVFEGMMPYIRAQYDVVNDPIETPYFMYGRKHEIMQLLAEKTKDEERKYKKYPLIILYHGQPERHGRNFVDQFQVSPLVSIVTDSTRVMKTDDRFTNSVVPILYPIYRMLIQEIANNPAFYQSYPEEIVNEIRIWDGNPSENKSAGLLYNDYLDGIDIQFTDLKLFVTSPTCPAEIAAH